MRNVWKQFKSLKTWQKVISVIGVLTIIGIIINVFSGNSNENIEVSSKESSIINAVERSTEEKVQESEISENSAQNTNEASSKAVPHRTGEFIVGQSNKSFNNDNINVTFTDYVRNDTTDNWRLARIAGNINIAEYVLDYYNNYFKEDKEVHAIVNFTTKTTTNITVSTGIAFVTIHEYVSGEEHDAKELFGGKVLESYIVYLDNGDIEKVIDDEPEKSQAGSLESEVSESTQQTSEEMSIYETSEQEQSDINKIIEDEESKIAAEKKANEMSKYHELSRIERSVPREDSWIDERYTEDSRSTSSEYVEQSKSFVEPSKEPSIEPSIAPEPTLKTFTFILNISTKKYHTHECTAAKKIESENRQDITISAYNLAEAMAQVESSGYDLCGICGR